MSEFSHLDDRGAARMVDISAKASTARVAVATGRVTTTAEVIALLTSGEVAKGDVLAVARVAGVMAAKQTPNLIPLCHPLALTRAAVDFELAADAVLIRAEVATTGPTGVEMEALTAVSVAALTIVDMIKSVDKRAVIGEIRVESKTGGKSGEWQR